MAVTREELSNRIEKISAPILVVLSLALLPLLAATLALHPTGTTRTWLVAADWFIWAAFALDLTVRLALARKRVRFLKKNWPLVLITLLPALKGLQVLRTFEALSLLEAARLGAILVIVHRGLKRVVGKHPLGYAAAGAVLTVVMSAGVVTELEQGHGGGIQDFGDGLWWAMCTVTTVGYGDVYPITHWGRAVGVILMVTGISLFLYIAANLAALVVERDVHVDIDELEVDEKALHLKLDQLLDKVSSLETQLGVDESKVLPITKAPSSSDDITKSSSTKPA